MERDYYAEEIGNQPKDVPDYYSQEIEGKVPKTESFLEKAMKIDPAQVGYEIAGGQSPLHIGMGLGAKATGQPFSSGLGITAQAEGMRKQAIENSRMNPFAKFATGVVSDPMTYVGLGEAGSVAGKAASGSKNIFRSLANPSKVYGESLAKSKGSVNFLDIVAKHGDDPVVKKVLEKSGVLEKFGGSSLGEGGSVTERLANLSPSDSQEFINSIKVGQNKSFLSGDVTKSNQIGLVKFLKDLSQTQSESLGMQGAKNLYGFSRNVGKGFNAVKKNAIRGAAITAGGTTAYSALEPFFKH